MHLILDIGNTHIKYHLFLAGKRVGGDRIDQLHSLETSLLKEYPNLSHLVYADVRGKYSHSAICSFFPKLKVHSIKSLAFPFTSSYSTPETLGEDRVALVAAALKNFPQQNCLIIDAGTCITYDLITAEKNYLGGAISPGLTIRFKSLHHFTGKLPQVEAKEPPFLWGDSTETSIQAGVLQGMVHEIEGTNKCLQSTFLFFNSNFNRRRCAILV